MSGAGTSALNKGLPKRPARSRKSLKEKAMRNPKPLRRLAIACLIIPFLTSCQTASSNDPEVVEETSARVEADRCEDWRRSLRFAGDEAEVVERFAALPEWAKKHLLAQDAAWNTACGSGD